MRHVYRCPVRWDDLDAYRHVNNVTFLEYFEDARVDLGRAAGLGREPHEGAVVVHQEIDYLQTLPFRTEPVEIEVAVVAVGTSSFTLTYEVRDGDVVFARGRSTQVAYDLVRHGPRRLSSAERSALARLVDAPSAAAQRR